MQHGSRARRTLQGIPTLTAGALDAHTARLDLHRHPLRDDQSARADKLLHGAVCLLQPGRQLPKRQGQAWTAVSSALPAWNACYEAACPSMAASCGHPGPIRADVRFPSTIQAFRQTFLAKAQPLFRSLSVAAPRLATIPCAHDSCILSGYCIRLSACLLFKCTASAGRSYCLLAPALLAHTLAPYPLACLLSTTWYLFGIHHAGTSVPGTGSTAAGAGMWRGEGTA